MNAPPAPPPDKRVRRQPTRINREIPRSVHALMLEVARAKYDGDTKPVICEGIRMAHAAWLEGCAAEARARAAIKDAGDGDKNEASNDGE